MKKLIFLLLFLSFFPSTSFAVDFKQIEQNIYKTIEKQYLQYIDSAGYLNLPEFNKNKKLLLFEKDLNYNQAIFTYVMGEYIKMFKYGNNIIVNTINVDNGVYYINMETMRFIPDIENDGVAMDIFNKNKQNAYCQIEIQNEHNIKFYNKQCENVFKKMLKMDF